MKHHPLHRESPIRIFAISFLLTVGSVIGVLVGKGAEATGIALILVAVELAFSFDNAILNAKILKNMSHFWQTMFLTIGVIIAIFGMRIVFPALIVAVTAHLSWGDVFNLALYHPLEYAEHLDKAHIALSMFGGAFLLVLALDFFMDPEKEVMWITSIEHSFQKIARNWAPPLLTLGIVLLIAALPLEGSKTEVIIAGTTGVVLYSVIHGLTAILGRYQKKKLKGVTMHVGMAAFLSFMYLQVLDATFSFDGVLGAFAVTQDVILIAIGLGIGAIWVRSLTVFLVRRGTLDHYVYIEHGAHYTIAILAGIMFTSIFVNVPEVIAGMAGIGVIGASIFASRQALKEKHQHGS